MDFRKYDGAAAVRSPAPTSARYGTQGFDTLQGTAGADELWGDKGDKLIGGAGGDTYYLQSPDVTVVEASNGGVDTIVSWGDIYLPRYANVENLEVRGDRTYGAGGNGDNIIIGGAGSQQLYGGFGQDVLVGGAGADTFIVIKGQGNDVVQDFAPGEDVVRLTAGFTDFSQVQAKLSQVGADVKLDLGGTDGLMFRNLQVGQLSAKDFQLQLDPAKLGALTFSDEFSGPLSLWDPESNPGGKWRPDFGYQGVNGVGSYTLVNNQEQQIYTSPYFRGHNGDFSESPFRSNADGTLSIIAKASNNTELFGYKYTSGLITTQPTFSQLYGYFEMRADLPETKGAWPAFWLLPADGSWPPELDVMETLTYDPRSSWTTKHTADGGHVADGKAAFVPDTADGFHTYGVLWTAETLTWFIDGVEVFKAATPTDMHKPMFMLANMAMGGWGGAIDMAGKPAEMKIDFIRAYALPGGQTPTPPIDKPSGVVDAIVNPIVEGVVGAGLKLVAAVYNDTLVGGAGADTLEAGQGQGVLTGGGGADTFVFKAMPWNAGRITDFQVGVDKLDLSALYAGGYNGANPVQDGYVTFVANGAGGVDVYLDTDGRASGNTMNFKVVTLDGVSLSSLTNQSVFGGAGAPTGGASTGGSSSGGTTTPASGVKLVAASYNDTLVGGAGNDTLEGGQGQGVLTGGAGSDTFVFKAMPWNAGKITDFQVGVDRLDISALYANGYAGSNPVADGYVTFVANGAGGTDVYLDTDGRASGNTINFKVVTLDGVSANGLTADGVFGARTTTAAPTVAGVKLTAQTYNATLTGGAGNDTLEAGQGQGLLTGGAGSDIFVFHDMPWNAGRISDFQVGVDKLDISDLYTNGYAGGNPVADGYVTFVGSASGGVDVYLDTDGPGGSNSIQFKVVTLDGVSVSSLAGKSLFADADLV